MVDLQTDLIGIDASRIVAPLRDVRRDTASSGLAPMVEVEGAPWTARMQELAAVPGAEPGAPIGSPAAQ